MSVRKPAIFLDRDGVINENRSDYVKSWDQYSFLPNVFDALVQLATSDYLIIVISNQSPIGRGIVQKEVIEEINTKMIAEIQRRGGRIDAIYYCPHAPEENCYCRKPKPGLFSMATEKYGIDMAKSFFVGDTVSDVEAAFNAGCKPIMVLTGLGEDNRADLIERGYEGEVPVMSDLGEAARFILGSGHKK